MPLLKTIDLFTGVGGMTRALRGLAAPVGYCEIDPEARDLLRGLMDRRALPEAPIHPDVRELDPAKARDVDMIVAGWPCVGFSALGHRAGFENAQSGLFKNLMRLVDAARPPFLFMENVAPIVQVTSGRSDSIRTVVDALHGMDYDAWWIVLPAHAVGAPHIRKRWFCLCVRRDVDARTIEPTPDFERFVWSRDTEPATRMEPSTLAGRARNKMMGNSVVPDCVRAAFCLLWTGLRTPMSEALSTATPLSLARPEPGKVLDDTDSPFSYACALGDGIIRAIPPPSGVDPVRDWGIVLDPTVYEPPAQVSSRRRTSGIVDEPIPRRLWATPRATFACYAAHVLTKRCKNDLGTQLRYDRATSPNQRSGIISPAFALWLMGYPPWWLG